MSEETTGGGAGWLDRAERGGERPRRWGLTIAWSMFEPDRIGETALLADDGREHVLGRGAPAPDETRERVAFFAQRPGSRVVARPLEASGISRDQLRLIPRAEGLSVRRTGRCALLVNGQAVQEASVAEGDVLELQNQLVLYCAKRATALPTPGGELHPFGAPDAHGMVGETEAIWRVRERVAFIASAERHVLVLGESGVGKELAAQAIHRGSPRRARALVARNAATFPPGLIDAELFGNRSGYPNPGTPERAGVIGQADGSTLFLDEIGEMPDALQAHLLRVLDGGEYHRLGESTARHADFRLVAGTNRPAEALKHDLAARLPLRLTIPPLRERIEDVPLLMDYLLRAAGSATAEVEARFFEDRGTRSARARVAPSLVTRLLRHDFPLNVRELDTILWAALSSSPGGILELTDEVEALLGEPPESGPEVRVEPGAEEIVHALDAAQGNKTQAARTLGVSRYALYRLMRKHDLR